MGENIDAILKIVEAIERDSSTNWQLRKEAITQPQKFAQGVTDVNTDNQQCSLEIIEYAPEFLMPKFIPDFRYSIEKRNHENQKIAKLLFPEKFGKKK